MINKRGLSTKTCIMINNKSKPIALFISAFFIGVTSFAQSIHFNYIDGTNASYNLEDVRKITFDGDVMNLHLWDGSVYGWNVSTIGSYQYDATALNVQEWLDNANAWDVAIFPNPTNSNLNVSFNLTEPDEVAIVLFNMQGKLILERNLGKRESGEYKEVLELANIPQGSYVCGISGKKSTITKHLVKQ
jgi:hypothetical protein